MTDAQLRKVSPTDLCAARFIAHRAVQHLTKAARANLSAQPDDSQSNLGWDNVRQSFLSRSIDGVYVGLSFAPFGLFILDRNAATHKLSLAGLSDGDAADWLDEKLVSMGLNRASDIILPYELPPEAAAIKAYPEDIYGDHFRALATWFDVAHQALTRLAEKNLHLSLVSSPVRCWPHHFDIATYVELEKGDPETARGIGVGLSPGDEGYAEPYVYINPWPHLNAETLPAPPSPGHWHTEGYVGLIATASEILDSGHSGDVLAMFVEEGFAIALKAQGS